MGWDGHVVSPMRGLFVDRIRTTFVGKSMLYIRVRWHVKRLLTSTMHPLL